MLRLLLLLFVAPHIDLNDNTPGVLCSIYDPDFDGFRYREKIAHCGRNITAATQRMVAERYHVEPKDYKYYEFDHLIPLALGGSNNGANIWPQRLDEAKQKDALEFDLYWKLRRGTIKQKTAIRAIYAWHAKSQ
jgi:hypothetical protein